MPRVRRRRHRRHNYTDRERHALLTGMVMHPWSTRFTGIHHKDVRPRSEEAIREAWDAIGAELLVDWESDEYAKDRERHGKPWAVRIMEGGSCQG